jgi:hypothetical protein
MNFQSFKESNYAVSLVLVAMITVFLSIIFSSQINAHFSQIESYTVDQTINLPENRDPTKEIKVSGQVLSLKLDETSFATKCKIMLGNAEASNSSANIYINTKACPFKIGDIITARGIYSDYGLAVQDSSKIIYANGETLNKFISSNLKYYPIEDNTSYAKALSLGQGVKYTFWKMTSLGDNKRLTVQDNDFVGVQIKEASFNLIKECALKEGNLLGYIDRKINKVILTNCE